MISCLCLCPIAFFVLAFSCSCPIHFSLQHCLRKYLASSHRPYSVMSINVLLKLLLLSLVLGYISVFFEQMFALVRLYLPWPTKRDNMWRSGRPGSFLRLEMECPERRTLIRCKLGFFSQSCSSVNFKQISTGSLNVREVLCTGAAEQMNYS